jgi:alkylation response protein AidB-like acyl-CoA dehydrogenase
VLAGIGFTAEHPFHRYLRRVLVLDQLFGTARALTEALGREILATRRIAHLLPL